MKKVIGFFKNKWVIQFLGILALSILIWFVGPLVSIAGVAFLESILARVIGISIIMFIWLAIVLVLQIKSNKANAQMVDELSAEDGGDNSSAGHDANHEVDELKGNFDSALQTLKKTGNKTQQGKHYLYDLPWYIIIGPPGSGKTTALINSGLEFPLAERLGKNSVRGVGGTRNCDWWFTDQAVLLDTAGRYTTQDSHEQVDKGAWSGFLDLLKKHRPRRPLNGVIVAMSLSDLLRLTEEERSLHAQAIRNRIEELTERLGIRIPIYMMFTKTDLIAGFTDFFSDLGKEERTQVWGVTFAEDEEQDTDKLSQVKDNYDGLLQRLNDRLKPRVQEERDLNRRNLIFGFPQRMAMLKGPLINFLDECFSVNRYQSSPLLRGVYLTSGTQEGTPIDRLMGVLAKTFRLERAVTPIFSGKGKSFFLTKLLKEVIFAESELVGLNVKVESRRLLMHRLFYVSVLVFTLLCAGLWTNSYLQNQDLLEQYSEKVKIYNALGDYKTATSIDFLDLLNKMNALRDVRDVYPAEDEGWALGFGLYQGDKLRELAQSNYDKQLNNHFLPMIKARLEQRMLSEESNNVEVLYQLLRVYLMLADKENVNIDIMRPWIKVDWGNSYPVASQQQLVSHLDVLFALDLSVQKLDASLIKEVRYILTQIPVAQQVYMRIKADGVEKHDNDFVLANELGSSGGKVFTTVNGKIEDQVIPGMFTYKGFHQFFLNESKDLAKQTVEQRWVLGDASFAGGKDLNALETKLFGYYYAEYIKRWDDLLANLKVRPAANINQSVEILEIVSGYDSPLRRLLEAVERETHLTRVAAINEGNALDKLKKGASEVTQGSRMQKLLSKAKAVGGESYTVDRTGKDVEKHFARLNEQVKKGASGSSPLDQIISDLSVLYGMMADLGSTSDANAALDIAKQGGGSDVIAKILRQSSRLPEPVKTLVKGLASGSQGLIMGGVRSQLNRSIQTEVVSICKSSIDGRYPITLGSRNDITLQDFGHFFSTGGVMDQFFNSQLKDFVDTSRRQWRVISQHNKTAGISSSTLTQFQYAAKIRKVFFQGGGQQPKVQFELKPVYLDAKASKFWINLEGQQSNYRHGPTRSQRFTWPGSSSGLVRYGFETLDGRQVSGSEEGAWAWFKLLDKMQVTKLSTNTYLIIFKLGELTAKYELRANSVINPFSFAELNEFQCPNRI